MKHLLKYALLTTTLSLAALPAGADQTNLVRGLDIQLSGLKQGDSSTFRNITTTTVQRTRVDTRDVIEAIGTATGVEFSERARLVLITPLPNGDPTVAIRDAGNSTDVSPFFGYEKVSPAVTQSRVNTRTEDYSGSSYSIQRFVVKDSEPYSSLPLHFNLSGVAVETFSNTAHPGPRNEVEADVSGAGDKGGELLILQGTIHIRGYMIEVVPSSGGDPT